MYQINTVNLQLKHKINNTKKEKIIIKINQKIINYVT